MSGSVTTPFFCSGESFLSCPAGLPTQADVKKPRPLGASPDFSASLPAGAPAPFSCSATPVSLLCLVMHLTLHMVLQCEQILQAVVTNTCHIGCSVVVSCHACIQTNVEAGVVSCKLAGQSGQAIASEGDIGQSGDDFDEYTSSLVFLEDGVFCRSSSGGAISGSVRTPFFCSGEFFTSGPLPSLAEAEVVKVQLPYCEVSAGSSECGQLWEPCRVPTLDLHADAMPLHQHLKTHICCN